MKTFINQIEAMEYYNNTDEVPIGQRFQTLYRAYVNDDGQIEYEVEDGTIWEITKGWGCKRLIYWIAYRRTIYENN